MPRPPLNPSLTHAPPPPVVGEEEVDPNALPPIPTLGHITPSEVHSALAQVNRGRFKLLTRVANLRLFDDVNSVRGPETIRTGDHPIIATILKMRDEMEHMGDPDKRLKALDCILKGLETATRIGEKSAQSLREALVEHLSLEQRKKEHEDKMELLREKLQSGSITIEQLERLSSEEEPTAPPGSIFDTFLSPMESEEAQPDATAASEPVIDTPLVQTTQPYVSGAGISPPLGNAP